jgi:hypothetical protein
MGNPLSLFLANLFMSRFETDAKEAAEYFPVHWYRYVDDIFTVLDTSKSNVGDFLGYLNARNRHIQFTAEEEVDGKLPFLDLLITREDGSLSFNIYRKPTNVDRYIPEDSFCHRSHKLAAFRFLIRRLNTIPLSKHNFDRELNYIKRIAAMNGYNARLVESLQRKITWQIKLAQNTRLDNNSDEQVSRRTVTFCGRTSEKVVSAINGYNADMKFVYTSKNFKLRSLLCNTKDKIPDHKKSIIYAISCQDCQRRYIGQTRRALSVRYKEHMAHLRYGRSEKSAPAQSLHRDRTPAS